MRLRTWPTVVGGLGCLLLLILVSSEAIRRKAREVYEQSDQVNTIHRNIAVKLQGLRGDIHLSGIFVRDYLLDNSHLTGPSYRNRLIELRQTTRKTLEELHDAVSPTERERVERLRANVEDYWETFDPLFDWTPNQKMFLSATFLRTRVLPRRDAVLELTRDIEAFNNDNMLRQRALVATRELELRQIFARMLWITMGMGIVIALGAGWRFHIVESRAEEQFRRLEEAESEMRRLSQLTVRAQEEERKQLSRELHDQVGQMLTALRMEVGHTERSRFSDTAFAAHTAECKTIIDTIVGTVRDLSMGLRPSMLDDIGLGPALQWLARDHSRRFNYPVNVNLEGELDTLPEPYRTCTYRVVQEALTNCARHAKATRVDVSVSGGPTWLRLWIRDNGIGMRTAGNPKQGLGLLGIQERVRELKGTMSLFSEPGNGTS
ncbi:MAG TPA: sensor histidine kinase, partial [Bryobacteraceae bacterium]|nr:sensor histidine kinase [Bryobacteraceae bacterium]